MPLHALADSSWQLARAHPLPLHAPLDDPGHLHDWLPARVPGSVQRDLMSANRLPDLYALIQLHEVLRWVNESDWWLQTELPAIQSEQRAWIDFAGIDYFAAVTVNGRELERRAGMYSQRRYELTADLRRGPAHLGVRIWGAWALPRWPRTWHYRFKRWVASKLQTGLPPFHDRLLSLKAPVHFGWDFAPALWPSGIWDDVHLHVTGPVAIVDAWARADWTAGHGLILRLELDALQTMTVTVTIKMTPVRNLGGVQVFESALVADLGVSVHYLHWPDAQLLTWSTHDRGSPNLYRLEIALSTTAGEQSDKRVLTVGARRFGWRVEKGVYYPMLNGEPMRFRGVNWVPLDLLSGDEQAEVRYRKLLRKMVDAGVNAIRVWGGGGRERSLFYHLCDEFGLLVWQEMPISCVFLDALPEDDTFLSLVQQETTGIIRSLRQHPAIVMWGGGNEWSPARFPKIAKRMSEVAAREDPSRRWLPASPGPNDSHNWQVWHGLVSPQRYAQDPAPLMSEFGLAAPPNRDVVRDMIPKEQLWPPGAAWQERKAELAKIGHYASYFKHDKTLISFIAASQRAQARGLQVGIEAYRLRHDAVGVFIWQWNEPWPVVSWSIIAYKGAPKRAYTQIARSYAPLAPIAHFSSNQITLWVVNDLLTSPGVCHLVATLNGRELWSGDLTPPINERLLVHTLSMPKTTGLLTLHLSGPGVDAHNDYPLPWPFPPPAAPGWRTRLESWGVRWLLRWS